jgi:hypothetical protein
MQYGLTDFLSFYNPIVRAMRAKLPWLPLPTFSFPVWLTGLIMGTILVLSLTPFAWRAVPHGERTWIRCN